ncbi:esterase-like activity of phytase family protein [Sphingomonas sp. AP4-R1]|uniref:esterase-like activity of phytase family protein n=1 Tax=Sphingomonas sp. AP4-R1 TaxID=2735134 RepID=UPI001493332C|nr:esterase-like activity of phytase family protein [Sphingomonas sp. AP4-R1]QJU57858.1 esterase-like activity of phytase family protein [Sphingomonas sp. AP4-R1]
MLTKLQRALLLAAVSLVGAGSAEAAITSLDYLSNTTFTTGTRYQNQVIAGLSGIDYNAATNTFIAQRDNTISGVSPVAFTLQAVPQAGGGYTMQFTGVNTLGGTNNGLTGLESIRYDPNGNGVWVTSEAPNAVYHIDSNGVRTQITLPASVTGRTPAGASNYGLEGMTFTPDGSLWVSRENALQGDATNVIRLSQIGTDGALLSQYAYQLDSVSAPNRPGSVIANPPGGGVGNNGVSEILAVSDTSFLVLERAWDGLSTTDGVSHNSIRIYQVDLAGATDVSGIQFLDGGTPYSALTKTLLFDSQSLAAVLGTYDTKIDNIEGMTFGPTLADGRRSLTLVSDNNNSTGQRKTQFIVLGVNETSAVPETATWAMFIIGFGAVGGSMRRRTTTRVRFA